MAPTSRPRKELEELERGEAEVYDSLIELDEPQLRRLLIKLFRRMGYQDVQHYHWGPLEQGKDIVMWKPNEAGVRRNWGVVVKAGRVKSAEAEIVSNQVRQCLNDSFLDPTSQGKQRVHDCYVVAPEITKEALNSLESLLGSDVGRPVIYLHGSRLISLLRTHLGDVAIPEDLRQIGQRLASLDDEWDVVSIVESDRILFRLRPKASVDSPRPLSVKVEFPSPDTQEGREVQDLLRGHKKTGAPVKIEGSLIKSMELPDFLMDLLGAVDQTSYGIELSQQTGGKAACEIFFEEKRTGEVTVLRPVVLEAVQVGTHEVTLTNANQDVPWKVELVVRFANGGYGRFRLDATITGASASRASEMVAFARALPAGGNMTVRSVDHDCQLAKFEVSPSPVDILFDDYTQVFCDAAKKIQDATGRLIVIPDRDLTAGEYEHVLRVARIVTAGRESVSCPVPMELTRDGLEKALEALGGDKPVPLYLRGNAVCSLLDTDIDLGPFCITWTEPPFANARIQKLRQVHRTLASDETYPLQLTLEDRNAVAVYEDWPE